MVALYHCYNRNDRYVSKTFDTESSPSVQYDYGANGSLSHTRNDRLNRDTYYENDSSNRPARAIQLNGTQHVYTQDIGYDE